MTMCAVCRMQAVETAESVEAAMQAGSQADAVLYSCLRDKYTQTMWDFHFDMETKPMRKEVIFLSSH